VSWVPRFFLQTMICILGTTSDNSWVSFIAGGAFVGLAMYWMGGDIVDELEKNSDA